MQPSPDFPEPGWAGDWCAPDARSIRRTCACSASTTWARMAASTADRHLTGRRRRCCSTRWASSGCGRSSAIPAGLVGLQFAAGIAAGEAGGGERRAPCAPMPPRARAAAQGRRWGSCSAPTCRGCRWRQFAMLSYRTPGEFERFDAPPRSPMAGCGWPPRLLDVAGARFVAHAGHRGCGCPNRSTCTASIRPVRADRGGGRGGRPAGTAVRLGRPGRGLGAHGQLRVLRSPTATTPS